MGSRLVNMCAAKTKYVTCITTEIRPIINNLWNAGFAIQTSKAFIPSGKFFKRNGSKSQIEGIVQFKNL